MSLCLSPSTCATVPTMTPSEVITFHPCPICNHETGSVIAGAELAEQLLEVKRLIFLGGWAWPGFARPIPGQLEPVLIRIAQVDRVGCPGAIRCRIDADNRSLQVGDLQVNMADVGDG